MAADTLNDALLVRAQRALLQAAGEADERVAADAVSAPSDALVLLRLLEQPEVLDALRAADSLAPARVRGIGARLQLIELAGGLLSVAEVAAVLDLTRQAIEKRRRAGRLLAVSLGRRGYRYPAFQFVDGQTLPGLERVLAVLGSRDAWTQMHFFVNRRPDLGDRSPAEVLLPTLDVRDDDPADAVIEAAEAALDQGAA
ncbi:MAG: hypothetical protein ABS36_19020 [Acidobacteria bacterium SCN 69-37]|nr:MAG: hypothetical protein ABS36_19020 [Acidobacteria bacterium SCN 69-37]